MASLSTAIRGVPWMAILLNLVKESLCCLVSNTRWSSPDAGDAIPQEGWSDRVARSSLVQRPRTHNATSVR